MAVLAKISRPIGRVIPRARLGEQMAGAPSRLFWIAAAAGSGKTSVAIGLAERHPGPVVWLRVDGSDSDPANFIQYLSEAIVHAAAAPGWNAPPLVREHLPDLATYLRLFVRSLTPFWAEPVWVVLDDVHRCQDAPFFGTLLDLLAEELPPGVRVLVLSRREPPQACARLLAHQSLREIPGSLLSFSVDETEALLASLEVPERERQSATVHALTGGWAAGTVLVAAWQKRRPGASLRMDQSLTGLVTGYLAAEVFESLSPLEQHALMAVCRLPYFTGGWAVALTGDAGAAAAVARVAGQGILISEYKDHGYALHHLLQGFLREQAERLCPEAQRSEWLARSVDLLEQGDNADAAVELALEAHLHERARPLIEHQCLGALAQARHETVARWVGALPEAHRSAMLWHWLGAATIPIDPVAARRFHLNACAAFRAEGRPAQRLLSLNPVIRSYYLNAFGSEPLRDLLARELGDPREYDALGDENLKAQLSLSVLAGLTISDVHHPELPLWEARTMEALRASQDPLFKAQASVILVHNDFLRGRYLRIGATRTALEAPPGMAGAHIYARYQAFAVNLYDELVRFEHAAVARSFAESRACSEQTGVRFMDGHYAIDMATALLLQGNTGEAAALLDAVAARTRPGQYNLAGHMHMIRGWVAAWAGEYGRALEHARLLRQASAGFGEGCPYAVNADILATLACALTDPAAAAGPIAALRAADAAGDFPAAAIHADLLEAWLALRRGDPQASHPFIAAAFARLAAEGSGYLTFALPVILQTVCAEAFEAGIDPALARRVVAGFGLSPPPEAGSAWPRPVTVRCFGGFELRVNGEPLASRGKSKHRQLDLLKMLAAHAPAALTVARVAESLWPDSDGDAARHALETTLSRLRASLGAEAIRTEHGALSLAPSACWSDTLALDRLLAATEAALAAGGGWETDADALVDTYRGELLAGDDSCWLLARREYWRARVGRVVGQGARLLAQGGETEAALKLVDRCLESDPRAEALTAVFLRLCLEAGRPAAGLAAFRRYQLSGPEAASNSREIEGLAHRLTGHQGTA